MVMMKICVCVCGGGASLHPASLPITLKEGRAESIPGA